MTKLLFSLLFLSLNFSSIVARGGDHNFSSSSSSLPALSSSFEGLSRHLLEEFLTRAHGYMSNYDLENAVKAFGQRCSNISKIYSIGESVHGIPLWVIEISDKPGIEEPEPAFKGELVANYPWDGTQDKRRYYYACPDDETFQNMASIYSRSHFNMSLSKEFPGGITNGASWYPIYGGMQDWNYIHGGCAELTLEISDNKWPNAEELFTIWEYNKLSMLNLVASLVTTGVHGRIFANSGRPLPGFIMIKGINYTLKAGRAFGDYHRLLAPSGRYEVIASMPGYKSKSTTIWMDEKAISLDFILEPDITTGENTLGSICGCYDGKSKLLMVEYLAGFHFEVYFILVLILAFLCLILMRRMKHNIVKLRHSPKRSAAI